MNRLKGFLAWLLYNFGFLALVRWFRVSVLRRPKVILLCYHRITKSPLLISAQCITPQGFRSHARNLSRIYDVWNGDSILSYLKGERVVKRDSIAFTFDDAYMDNKDYAAAVLSELGISGIFFACSRTALHGRPLWIDELSLWLSRGAALRLPYPALSGKCRDLYVRFANARKPSQKAELAKNLFLYLQGLSHKERVPILEEWRQCAPHLPDSSLPTMMRADDLRELQALGHEIGGHTVHHWRLSSLSEFECRQEIEDNRIGLIGLGLNIRFFAYPFGKGKDIGPNTPSMVEECGYAAAFTTIDNCAESKSPFMVSRKVVPNQSVAQLCLKLELMAWGIA